MFESGLHRLLHAALGPDAATQIFQQLDVAPALFKPVVASVSRAELAQALNMTLFRDLTRRVPVAASYVADQQRTGQRVLFDHGAVRSVAWPAGALPPGEAAITRVLGPLGFGFAQAYPLPRLKMVGRAWRHQDLPEDIAQFFVSELHPECFSSEFQAAVTRVLSTSRDPLDPVALATLEQLARDRVLPWPAAEALLPQLLTCFERQHGLFTLADYELLLRESAEMAWIATEGNAFNHATDRVADLDAVANAQRALGRPIKASIEVSSSGRVRQTAFRAAHVSRQFLSQDEVVAREVPGSFYEFIQRERVGGELDLGFDAANATGIFKMTTQALEPEATAG